MFIRKADFDDLDRIMYIYDCAKKYMRNTGNLTQWVNGYPSRNLIVSDIEKGQCYVCDDDGTLHAVFVFIIGEDPTYKVIEDGEWLNNEQYGTVHRIASDGTQRGILAFCVDHCKKIIPNLRADTHNDNVPMQKALSGYGFKRCGIIHIADGSPRIAYQYKEGAL